MRFIVLLSEKKRFEKVRSADKKIVLQNILKHQYMMKHYYLKFALIIGCLLLWDCNKTTTAKNFYDYEFNNAIAGDRRFNIGHRFTINKEHKNKLNKHNQWVLGIPYIILTTKSSIRQLFLTFKAKGIC
ncbi:hypothetical protein IW22_16320 [Chryseobacterium sp. JM1]|nr:hypothetical protein IW22_16320 [Chryseobacterium sp. JM1]